MKLYLEVITTPTSDTAGTSVLVHFDDKRYVFGNIPEGTQRAFVERGIRPVTVDDIFLTGRTEWKNTGGLLGMMLSVADAVSASAGATADAEIDKIKEVERRLESAQHPKLVEELEAQLQRRRRYLTTVPEKAEKAASFNLRGGPNLARTLATSRTFVCRRGMPVLVQEFGDDERRDAGQDTPLEPTWSDDHIKLWALPIYPSTTLAGHPGGGSKRDFSAFQESAGLGSTGQSESASQGSRNLVACQDVVSEMFHSTWDPNDMVELPLAEAPASATLFVRDPFTNKLEKYTGPKSPGHGANPDLKVLVRKPWPGAMIDSLPATSPSQCSMSYIFRSHDIRGKFDPQKAKEHRVRWGPDCGLLTQGHSVTSIDGQTVTPDMVLGQGRTGRGIAILDLPTVEYVDSLLSRPEWKSEEVIKGAAVFIWNLGPGVGDHPRLREFIATMSQCKHFFASPDFCANGLVFEALGRMTTEFSQIDAGRYSSLFHDNKMTSPMLSGDKSGMPDIQTAESGLTIDMEPKFNVTPDKRRAESADTQLEDRGDLDKTLSAAAEVRRSLEEPEAQERLAEMRQTLPGGDAEIITLGTGSSLPSRWRNVSGTLIRVPGQGSYLLDCGEGTLGQLQRTLGPSEFKEVLRDLKMIWISHIHADHHLGVTAVIKAWYKEVFGTDPRPSKPQSQEQASITDLLEEKRLFVVSERIMLNWLGEYACVENYGYDKTILLQPWTLNNGDPDSFCYSPRDSDGQVILSAENKPIRKFLRFNDPSSPLTTLLQQATGLSSLLSVRVRHCAGSRAASLCFPSGLKVSFSGDARPSEDFARIGQDSTVLLHEATFEDELRREAVAKSHSTVSEAIAIGKLMQAKVVVLTHFSQRYREMPVVNKHRKPPLLGGGGGVGGGESSVHGAQNKDETEDLDLSSIPNEVRDVAITDEAEDGVPDTSSGPGNEVGSGSGDPAAVVDGPLDAPVVLAFDHMRLRIKDALVAESYAPVFRDHLMRSADDD